MEITRTGRLRWQRGMCHDRTCTAMPPGRSTHIFLKGTNRRTTWPNSAGACTACEMQRQSGRDTWSEVLKDGSMKVGTACLAFFCNQDRNFKGLCHGDDFVSAEGAKELKILNRTIKIDV